MIKFISSLITIFLIGNGNSVLLQPYNAKVILYKDNNCSGDKLEISERYEPWLYSRGSSWNNGARSASVSGTWLFYDFSSYNYKIGNAGVEYIFGPNQFCQNFTNLMLKVSSVRFAGVESDYRNDSLTLYSGKYFQGNEEFIVADLPHINLEKENSFIITGTSGWTFYEEISFQGEKVCIFPSNSSHSHSPAFVFDAKNVLPMSFNFIRSIRKGCFSGDIFIIEEIFHGMHNVER